MFDGIDAFNRVLERLEELVEEKQRTVIGNATLQKRISELADENGRLTIYNQGYGLLERFAESSPEMEKAWADFCEKNQTRATPRKTPETDIPF